MSITGEREIVLRVQDLRTEFRTRRGVVRAVNGVSFDIHRGEIVGLVGESGSGKSVTALSILRLVPSPNGRIVSGKILFEGRDLLSLSPRELRRVRGAGISMILQDPLTSLNPVYSVGNQIGEAFRVHDLNRDSTETLLRRVVAMLRRVGIPSPEVRMHHYPHQLSGGMRQRVVAAIALASSPKLLIADEPTTALDVTIQAQFLDLLRTLREADGLSILFITHDLGIVAQLCDRVVVMYAGIVVETGPVRRIFKEPAHPYTDGLIRSVPTLRRGGARLFQIEGQPPDLTRLSSGCPFAPRCQRARDLCEEAAPPETSLPGGGSVRCWYPRVPQGDLDGLSVAEVRP